MSQRRRGRAAASKSRRTFAVALIVAVAVAVIAVISYINPLPYILSTPAAAPYATAPGLTATDIAAVVPGQVYTTVMQNNSTLFAPQLRVEGYVSATVSVFNATGNYSRARNPAVIASEMLVMANASSATNELGSLLLYSNNANQTVSSFNYTTMPGGVPRTVRIYSVNSIAVFNSSVAGALNLGNIHMPDYQYVTVFERGTTVAMVFVNGYVPSANFSSYSTALAERLAERMQ